MTLGNTIDTSTLNQTFDDEFNTFSASPDGSAGLWQTTLGSANRTLPGNGELEYYSDSSVGVNPFSIQNGVLDISATPGSNPLGLPYNSGAINTQHSFSQLYGYFEVDAKMPAGQGLWPAFWLLPESGAWPPELDAFEVLGNNPNTLYFSTHSSLQATQGTTLNVADVSSGFNLYGVMWGPQTVDLYINNVEVASMPTPADMNVSMFMNINLAVGGYWPGNPDSTTQFPANMLIDYVRAYAYPGTSGGTVTASPAAAPASVAPASVAPPSSGTPAATASSSSNPIASAPVVTTPATFTLAPNASAALSGVSVADSQSTGRLIVTVSDSTGLLNTTATSGVTEQGEGSTVLTLTGSTGAINAELATLTYNANAASDWLWVSAADPGSQQAVSSPVVVTANAAAAAAPNPPATATNTTSTATATPAAASGVPTVSTPASLTVAAGTSASLSGVSVADSQTGANLTVMVSDSSGLLNAGATNGLTEQGQGSTTLVLSGSASAINAGLAGLTYTANAGATSDWLWVSANPSSASSAPQAISPVVVTVGSAPSSDTVNLTGVMLGVPDSAGFVTATLSDNNGILATTNGPGVTESGENSSSLVLQGMVAAVNAELASLTYSGTSNFPVAGSSDTLTVAVAGSGGNQLNSFVLPLLSGHLAT